MDFLHYKLTFKKTGTCKKDLRALSFNYIHDSTYKNIVDKKDKILVEEWNKNGRTYKSF